MRWWDLRAGDVFASEANHGVWVVLRVEQHALAHVRWLTTLNLRSARVNRSAQDGRREVKRVYRGGEEVA